MGHFLLLGVQRRAIFGVQTISGDQPLFPDVAESSSLTEDETRYFNILFEDLRTQLQVVAEASVAHTKRFDRIEEKQDTFQKELSLVKDTVVFVREDVSVLKTDVSVLKTDVSVLKTGQNRIEEKVDRLDEKFGVFAAKTDERLTKVEADVVVLKDELRCA